jgi:hypothetical protein
LGGGGQGLEHVFIKGGYCKMSQIVTRGEGPGWSIKVQKFNTYFLNGP